MTQQGAAPGRGESLACTVALFDWQILDASTAPEQHACNLCCGPANATDPELASIHESEAQMVCLWRRSLAACLEVNHISAHQLASRLGIAKSLASRLVDRLVSEGYAAGRGIKNASGTKFVQKRKIKREALVKYFSRNNDAVVDVEP